MDKLTYGDGSGTCCQSREIRFVRLFKINWKSILHCSVVAQIDPIAHNFNASDNTTVTVIAKRVRIHYIDQQPLRVRT